MTDSKTSTTPDWLTLDRHVRALSTATFSIEELTGEEEASEGDGDQWLNTIQTLATQSQQDRSWTNTAPPYTTDAVDEALWEESAVVTESLAQFAWRSLQETWQQLWTERKSELEWSLQLLKTQATARGGQPTFLATFVREQLQLNAQGGFLQIAQHEEYALTFYFPQAGYIAVLQMENHHQGLEFQLVYPKHFSQIKRYDAGQHTLFETRFKEVGHTRFVFLCSPVPWHEATLIPWPQAAQGESWSEELTKDITNMLLEHMDNWSSFVLDVEVTAPQSITPDFKG